MNLNRNRFVHALLLSGLLVVFSSGLHGAEWNRSASLSSDLVFTDNVDLSPTDTRSGTTLRIRPSIGLTGTGRRMNMNFFYAPSYTHEFYSGGEDNLIHYLSTDLQTELSKNSLFLDANASASLSLVNPFGADYGLNPGDDFGPGSGGGQNPAAVDNTTQTYRLGVSPYIRQHYGPYADLDLRYTHDRVWYDSNGGKDSHSNSMNFSFQSGRYFNLVDWTVTGDYQRVEYEGGDHSILANYLARAGYRVNRKLRLNAYVGFDDNNFLTLANALDAPDSDGFAYGGGLTWTPSPRTTLDVAVAKRFFGTNLYFDYSHRRRHSIFTASLTHEPTNSRNELLTDEPFTPLDEFGEPIERPEDEPVNINPDAPILSTNDYVRHRLNANYTLQRRRDTVNFSGFYTLRDYDISESKNRGLASSWTHSRASTSFNARIDWRKQRPDNSTSDTTQWNLSAGASHAVTRRSDLSLRLSHLIRDSDTSLSDYTENRATLSWVTSLGQRSNAAVRYVYRDRSADNPVNEFTENRITLSLGTSWN